MDQNWEPTTIRRSTGVSHRSSYAATGAAGKVIVERTGDLASSQAARKLE